MQQLKIALFSLFFVIAGIILGWNTCDDYRDIQHKLDTSVTKTVKLADIVLKVSEPQLVAPERSHRLVITFDDTPQITSSGISTLSLIIDPHFITPATTLLITHTGEMPQWERPMIEHQFNVRGDVQITDTVHIGTLIVEAPNHTRESQPVVVAVFQREDFINQYWWQILWAGISGLILLVIVIGLGMRYHEFGLALLIICIALVIIFFPELVDSLKSIIETVAEIWGAISG